MDKKNKELSRKDVWRLIFQMYRATFKYVLFFVLAMTFATWFITEILLQ